VALAGAAAGYGGDRRRPVTGGAVRGSRRAVGLASEGRGEVAARNGESQVEPGRLRRVTLAAHSFSTARVRPSLFAATGRQARRAEGAPLFPDLIASDLRTHLDQLAPAAALVFTSPDGQPLRHSNFYRRVWMPASAAIGLAGVHLHDLRHTGNQFIADAGANPRELMARMGHDSARAALIYLHSSAERQRALANEVGKNARAALRQPQDKPKRSGTRKARNRREAS